MKFYNDILMNKRLWDWILFCHAFICIPVIIAYNISLRKAYVADRSMMRTNLLHISIAIGVQCLTLQHEGLLSLIGVNNQDFTTIFNSIRMSNENVILLQLLVLAILLVAGFPIKQSHHNIVIFAPWMYGVFHFILNYTFETSTDRFSLGYNYLSISLFLTKYFLVSGLMVAQLFCFEEMHKKTGNETVTRFVITFSLFFLASQLFNDFFLIQLFKKQLWVTLCVLYVILFGFIEDVKFPISRFCCDEAANKRQMMLNKVRYPIQISIVEHQKSPIEFKV